MSQATPESSALVPLTADVVAAYVAHHHVPEADLPRLIATIHGSLVDVARGAPAAPAEPAFEKPTAAEIRRSITPDALISFIDGRGYKTLKRHLTEHGLTPDGYRARFGLPADYPLTSASYSAQRSSLAKALGLGQSGRRDASAEKAQSGSRKAAA